MVGDLKSLVGIISKEKVSFLSFNWLKKMLNTPCQISHRIDRTFKAASKMPTVLPKKLCLDQTTEIENCKTFITVRKIISVLDKTFPNVNKQFLNRNLASLKIEDMKVSVWDRLLNQYFDAAYGYKTNTIKLGPTNKALSHEVLHLASTYYDGKSVNSGFSFRTTRKGKSCEIGRGINEGYTSLLDLRYFQEIKKEDSYSIERNASLLLEMMIGRLKMQEMYFNADGCKLIEELKKFDSEENVIEFLRRLDFLNFVVKYRKKVNNQNVLESINFICQKLYNWCFTALERLNRIGKISVLQMNNLKAKTVVIIDDILNQKNEFRVDMYDNQKSR